MKTIKIKLYSFNELSSEAQNKALSKCVTINVEHDWWDSTYMDAEQVGLKITGFDLDRNKHATGQLTLNALEVAQNIINNHGEECETYKTAQKFLSEHAPIFADYMNENSEGYESAENEGKLSDLESGFLDDLLSDYADMLQKECYYLMSDESIKETFEANDYTFEQDGKMNNTQPEQEPVLKTAWDFVERYHPNYSSSDEICACSDLMLKEESEELSQEEMEQKEYYLKEIYEQAIENFINTQNK